MFVVLYIPASSGKDNETLKRGLHRLLLRLQIFYGIKLQIHHKICLDL